MSEAETKSDHFREHVGGKPEPLEDSKPTINQDSAPKSPSPNRPGKQFSLSKYAAPAGFVLLILLARIASKVDWTKQFKAPAPQPSRAIGSALTYDQQAREFNDAAKRWRNAPSNAGRTSTTTLPVTPHNPAMLEATQRAWAGMQAIDAEADNTDFGAYPSKGVRQVAFAYSQLPLGNVDPAFVQHVLRSVAAMKKAAAALEVIEAKRDALDAQENTAAEFGTALGAADGASPEQAAGIGGLLGVMAAAGNLGARDQLAAELAAALRPIEAEANAIEQAEAELASRLSQKYGVPFIDPF
jgi:hypothetical protein